MMTGRYFSAFSILLFFVCGGLFWGRFGFIFGEERILLDLPDPPAAVLPKLPLPEEAPAVLADTFSLSAENIKRDSSDPEAVWVEFTLQWPESLELADGTSLDWELFRLMIDAEKSRLLDSQGEKWRPITGGMISLQLLEDERSKPFSLKLVRESASDEPAPQNNEAPSLPIFVDSEIVFSTLIGWMPYDYTFPDIFAPRLNESAAEADRIEYGFLTAVLHSAQRLSDTVRIVVSVEYNPAFDFFDSHEERFTRRKIWLKRQNRAKNDSALTSVRRRPQKMSERGETTELDFSLPLSLSGSDEWNLILNLPTVLTEENFTKQVSNFPEEKTDRP